MLWGECRERVGLVVGWDEFSEKFVKVGIE